MKWVGLQSALARGHHPIVAIVISALHFFTATMDDCYRLAREELGLDGEELSLHKSFTHAPCMREDLARLPALKER